MKIYYVNTNPKAEGHHEVHVEGCTYLATFVNRRFLGHFHDAQNAIREARIKYPTAQNCKTCLSGSEENQSA